MGLGPHPQTQSVLPGPGRVPGEVHHGLGIEVPILLCCSTASAGAEATREEALRCDVVLSVDQMLDRAPYLGNDVTVRQIEGGVHDLALSPEPARTQYLQALTG